MAKKSVEPIYKEIGRRLSEARNRLGLTQEKLGGKLDPRLTRAAIANIETGKQRILAHTLLELSRLLGINLQEFAEESTHKPDLADIEAELSAKLSPETASSITSLLQTKT